MRNTLNQISNEGSVTMQKSEGFTLIEMAIVIMITGLLIAGAASAYTLYIKDKRIQETRSNTTSVVNAISEFRTLYGRYPCPASLSATPDNALYGKEDCGLLGITPGTCANGACTEEAANYRNISYKSGGAMVTGRPLVTSGFVPFRELNLPEKRAYDGYGGRLRYVVTDHLTKSNSFDPDTGGIEILSATGNNQSNSVLDPPSSADFVVISHGEDMVGAYTRDGVQLPCPNGTFEFDNCNEGKTKAIYRLARSSKGNSNQDFDDRLLYFAKGDIPLWQMPEGGDNTDVIMKPTGDIGISFDSSQTVNSEAQANGTIRARDSLMANNFCLADGTDCFPPSLISGPLDETDGENIACPSGRFMVGIEHQKAVCVDKVWVICPEGQALLGFDEDGKKICESPPLRCATQNVEVCAKVVTLPEGKQGQKETVTGGDNGYKIYKCNKGKWGIINDHAKPSNCNCADSTQTNYPGCGEGFAGSPGPVRTRTIICPQGTWSDWEYLPGQTWEESCTCVEKTETQFDNCPNATYSGQIKKERTHICSGPGAPKWTAWTVVEDTCACVSDTQTNTRACTGGLTPKAPYSGYLVEKHVVCPAGTWTDWKEVSGSGIDSRCECVPGTETKFVSCPVDKVGGPYKMQQDRTCVGGLPIYSEWTDVPGQGAADVCTDPPVVVCEWRPNNGGTSDQPGPISPRRAYDTCDCGGEGSCYERIGSNYTNYTSCSCR